MQRKWIYALAVALLLTLSSGGLTAAPKSRASKKSAKASGKNKKNVNKKGGKVKKELRGKVSAKASRNRASRRERAKAVVSRRGRRGRDRYISRKAERRLEAKSQAGRAAADEAQEPSAPPPPRVVASGIPADRVIEIQNALIRAGHFQGPASGQYDEATASAMKQFQTANGLRATGLPTAHTLKKLGVSKRSGDGYAMPVKSVTEQEKRP